MWLNHGKLKIELKLYILTILLYDKYILKEKINTSYCYEVASLLELWIGNVFSIGKMFFIFV